MAVLFKLHPTTRQQVDAYYTEQRPKVLDDVIKGVLMFAYVRAQFPEDSVQQIMEKLDLSNEYGPIEEAVIGEIFTLANRLVPQLFSIPPRPLTAGYVGRRYLCCTII
jgi:hypothetical protein